MFKIKNIALLFFLFCSAMLFAQEDLPTEEIDVFKSFNAHLLDTEKQVLNPKLPPLDTSTRHQQYMFVDKTLLVDYSSPKIKPLAFRGDALKKSYNGFAKVGAGLPNSLYVDGAYDLIAEKNTKVGLDVFHHSANNNQTVENQKYANTAVGVNGTYYHDLGFAVNADLGFKNNTLYYYGYNDLNEERGTDFTFLPDEVRQKYNTIEASGSIFNGERTEMDFNYSAGIDVYNLKDNYAARENGFVLSLNATKWFDELHPLSVNLITDFTTYKDTSTQNLNNFYLQPSYTYNAGIFKAKIGVNVVSHNDAFKLFPDIEISGAIIEGLVSAFAGAKGSLHKNNLKNLSDYNPFISSRIRLENSSYNRYYAGIKGNFQGVDYNIQAGLKNIDDLPLYTIDPLDSIPTFDVMYDTATIVNIKGSVSVALFDDLQLTGTFSQNFYSLEREDKPWHLPGLSLNAGVKYSTMEDKLHLLGEFFFENGVPYRDDDGKNKHLNPLFDISLGAEFFFTDNLGAFISLNNLAANNRQRWHRYPVYGLNVLLGFNARF